MIIVKPEMGGCKMKDFDQIYASSMIAVFLVPTALYLETLYKHEVKYEKFILFFKTIRFILILSVIYSIVFYLFARMYSIDSDVFYLKNDMTVMDCQQKSRQLF